MSALPLRISSIKEISDRYDVYLIDLCGIVHNGVKLFSKSVQAIDFLSAAGKKIIFLSNAPQRESVVSGRIHKMGFDINSKGEIVTSGEYFRHFTSEHPEFLYKKKFFHLCESTGLLDDLDLTFSDSIAESDYFIINCFTTNLDEFEPYYKLMGDALSHGVKGLCLNPDIIAPHGDETRYTPGYLAKKYEELGGEITYFGKPHTGIYEYVCNKFDIHTKSRILMIGDAVPTDITGARNFGIDSLLIPKHGVHRDIFYNMNNLTKLFKESGMYPTYICDELVI